MWVRETTSGGTRAPLSRLHEFRRCPDRLTSRSTTGLADNTSCRLGRPRLAFGRKGLPARTLSERTRVLVFAGPGVKSGGRRTSPPSCWDLSHAVELCGLPPRGDLRLSLLPLQRPASGGPAITVHTGNHMSAAMRYIRYADGSEELYDMQNDPRSGRTSPGGWNSPRSSRSTRSGCHDRRRPPPAAPCSDLRESTDLSSGGDRPAQRPDSGVNRLVGPAGSAAARPEILRLAAREPDRSAQP